MAPYTQEPVSWKVIVGLLLIFVEVKNHVDPTPNLLKADNQTQQFGMNAAMFALIAPGCSLVYSGVKPIWRKTR